MSFNFNPFAIGSIIIGILLILNPDPYAGAYILIIGGIVFSFVRSTPSLEEEANELENALKEKERSKRILKRLFWVILILGSFAYFFWLQTNQV